MRIKKADIILLISCIVVFGFATALTNYLPGDGDKVIVSVNGETVSKYSLSEDGKYLITGYNGGENILLIENGKASIVDADCPDGLCVKQKAISSQNETICCLPNRVIVEVTSDNENEVDAIAR